MDVTEHPDYEKGYEARLYGRLPRIPASAEYMAGYAAATTAQDMFRDAGFIQTAKGHWTKVGIVSKND